jgi:hypothetical protein
MNKLFSLSELNQKVEDAKRNEQDKSELVRIKFLNKHYNKVDNLKSLMGSFPPPGEAFFIWTLNSFNAFTFIVYVIKTCGKIEDLTISTYSLNERILNSLIKWYDKGEIIRVNISIAESIKHRMPRVYDQLQIQSQTRNFDIRYTWNHSKVTLMQTGEHHFVVEGSGNFSENAMYEQYMFMNDKQLFDFRKNCIMT